MKKAKSKRTKREIPNKSLLEQIEDESYGCRYCEMFDWQRRDLSKEELFEYAEEMRKSLNKINDLVFDTLLDI